MCETVWFYILCLFVTTLTRSFKKDSSGAEIAGTLLETTETNTYNNNGSVVTSTDASGITKTYTYDALNRVISVTESKGDMSQTETTIYSYETVETMSGNFYALATETRIGNDVTEKTWTNGYGQTVRNITGDAVTDYVYDKAGNRFAETVYTAYDLSEYILTVHVYDKEQRQTAEIVNPVWNNEMSCYVIDDTSVCETYEYDARGNITKNIDALGYETAYEYDEQNRLTKVILAEDNAASYSYSEGYDYNDKYYSKVTSTNAIGAVSEEISDAAGNLIKISDKGVSADTAITVCYEYDELSNLVKEIKSAGYITYTYDSMDRLTGRYEYTSAGVLKYKTLYTYYSGVNLVKDMKDYEGDTLYHHTYYEYDTLGRLTGKAESSSEISDIDKEANLISYTYDLKGQITDIDYGSVLRGGIDNEISGTRYEYSSSGNLTACQFDG